MAVNYEKKHYILKINTGQRYEWVIFEKKIKIKKESYLASKLAS
jgi:hypothetical protein